MIRTFKLSSQIRTMASSTAGKFEYIVIIPDHGGVLDKRMAVRPYVFLYPILGRLFWNEMIGKR